MHPYAQRHNQIRYESDASLVCPRPQRDQHSWVLCLAALRRRPPNSGAPPTQSTPAHTVPYARGLSSFEKGVPQRTAKV